jgi:general secretion pathway protein D
VLTGETTIIPDPGTNSLLIRANRSDFDLITAAVKELDVRPLQVLIEVLIAEVRKDRSFSFGVDASLPPTRLNNRDDATVTAHNTGLGLGDFAVRVMKLGHADLDVTLSAAAARGDARIVSRPVVLASNNEEAQILVGSQRPFVQVSRTLPTDNAARDQVVQYREVGTKLTVRPTISADGYVMLEVTQDVNQATAETQFDAPIISTRTVQTRLLVRDSQTVVLGGLTDRQKDATQGGVPVLSSIPLLGGLFGRASRQTTETEFFLFITPRVIRSDEEAEQVTQPLEKRARKVDP